MSVNKIILLGYLGKDPELKTFDNGGKVANFSLATSERAYTTKSGQEIPEQTQWHQIKVNGKMADVAAQYLKKGSKIYLEGILRYRKYTDANGVEKYLTEIQATTLHMLTPKSESAQHAESSNANPFGNDEDDDLPF